MLGIKNAAVLMMLVGAALLTATSAGAQHLDALVFEDGGQVQMGQIDVDCLSGTGDPGCDPNGVTGNVYEAELQTGGTSPGLFGFGDEPGFFALPTGGESALPYGNLLPSNAGHTIDIVMAPSTAPAQGSILYWDGNGPVSWSAVTNAEFFDITGNGGTGGVLNGTNELLGIALDSTRANQSFDTHPDWELYGPGGTDDPRIGFYTLFGTTDIDGLATSELWAAVFDFGVDDETKHEAAIDSVASFIPEPTTGVLMGLGLIGLAFGGRRSDA